MTPVTTAFASINVAGPRSRELVRRLTAGVDLDPDAFGYMRVRTGRVAGVEAQRILRLAKGHAIVGQDTDGLTQAYSAALEWAVKLDKDDFVGKPELVMQRSRDDYLRLVGQQPVDGAIMPPETSQIVEDATTIVGRVTSSRMSPTLGRAVCLGYVAPHLARSGTTVAIQLPDGRRVAATVMPHLAHVDPHGARLRG